MQAGTRTRGCQSLGKIGSRRSVGNGNSSIPSLDSVDKTVSEQPHGLAGAGHP